MSKQKPLKIEEKKEKMLEIFHEKREVYQLKELEKIAPKEKGIVLQSVKDVLQMLVDDGLVDTDKIGTSLYYWSYPSKAKATKRKNLESLKLKDAETDKQLEELEEELNQEKKKREDIDNVRENSLKSIAESKEKNMNIKIELEQYKDYNPEKFEKIKSQSEKLQQAGNRWTDNVYAVKTWCKNKFNIEDQKMDKQFGIPSDFDYIE